MSLQNAKEAFIKAFDSLHIRKEIPTFGLKDIREMRDMYRLRINLAKTDFYLPLVRLPIPPPNDAAIGWFDPNPEVNPLIDKAATETMTKLLQKMKPKVVVMTNSSKSENFIKEAVKEIKKKSPKTKIILMSSGDKKADVTSRSETDLVSYTPVTGTNKFMGYATEAAAKISGVDYMSFDDLKKLCPDGKGLVLVDDVYTTGETMRAMEKVLGLTEKSKHRSAVIAVEQKFDGKYLPMTLPKNLKAAIRITEFERLDDLKIDRNKLFIYDKPTIPQALVGD